MSLIKAVRDWIFAKTGIAVNEYPLQHSDQLIVVVGLLIKLAETDGDLSPDESAKIVSFAGSSCGINTKEAMLTFVQADKKTRALSAEDLLAVLDKELLLPQKIEFVQMLYDLMKVDNKSTAAEKNFVSKVVAAIHVPEDLHAQAYHRALQARVSKKEG